MAGIFPANNKITMCRAALDIYDDLPKDMRRYLRNNGWHFNKKACHYAVGMMKKRNMATGKRENIEIINKDQLDELMAKNNITLDHNTGYDYVFVANMCKADFLKSSVPDESHLALYVKDVIDDVDAGDGSIMRKWYAGMVAKGEIIEWDEMV